MIVAILAEIRTGFLPNTSQNCYRLSQFYLLANVHFFIALA